jgi:hypothetical protein
MKNKTLAIRKPSPLVCVWYPTGDSRMPLVALWVEAETVKPCPSAADSSSDETGGLRLCA